MRIHTSSAAADMRHPRPSDREERAAARSIRQAPTGRSRRAGPGQRPGSEKSVFSGASPEGAKHPCGTRADDRLSRSTYYALSGFANPSEANLLPRPLAWALVGRPFGAQLRCAPLRLCSAPLPRSCEGQNLGFPRVCGFSFKLAFLHLPARQPTGTRSTASAVRQLLRPSASTEGPPRRICATRVTSVVAAKFGSPSRSRAFCRSERFCLHSGRTTYLGIRHIGRNTCTCHSSAPYLLPKIH